jgi:hypothetical protein
MFEALDARSFGYLKLWMLEALKNFGALSGSP